MMYEAQIVSEMTFAANYINVMWTNRSYQMAVISKSVPGDTHAGALTLVGQG
jgi:hypothetical protein